MKFILGKKMEMTHKYDDKGNLVPVTVVKAGPCLVSQVKTVKDDGYNAVQLAYDKVKKLNKPQKGHLKDVDDLFRTLKEFKISESETTPKVGDEIKVDVFEKGENVNVTARSKGKGFQGVVKRYDFRGAFATHGTKDQLRMPGSIGATGNARVYKGTRMGGHTGNQQVTVQNLQIVEVDAENNLLYIKGSVPGARN